MKYWKEDKRTIISPVGSFLTTTLVPDDKNGNEKLYSEYLELMGHGKTPIPEWMSKEDFIIQSICRGLGQSGEKFSDIINEALVAGGLEIAKCQAELRKEFGITE